MRAIAYIDGFNLYYGSLKSTPHKWLNIQSLCEALTPSRYDLVQIRYFTAKVKPRPAKPTAHTDQQAYLTAIDLACSKVIVQFGHFQVHRVRAENACPPPPTVDIFKIEEKGSDVNLAVHLLNDAYSAGIQAALLISNDADLAAAVSLARARGIEVYWYPPLRPGRYASQVLSKIVSHQRSIHGSAFKKHQFPNRVTGEAGKEISKPSSW